MRRNRLLAAIAGLAALPAAALAQADVSTAFTYQGRLVDNGSAANGQYDFEFRLFNSVGTQVGAVIFVNNQQVTDGVFTRQLDFGEQYFGRQIFLEIRVRPGPSGGAFTILGPRQELTGAPYAHGLQLPFAGAYSGAAPAFAIANSAGPDLAVGGDMIVGSPEEGSIALRNAGGATTGIIYQFGGMGTAFDLFEETGAFHTFLEPDSNGTGGFFFVANGNGGAALVVDGNASSGNPFISFGGRSNVTFDLDQTGNDAVRLPADAISAAEILDEPGGARIGSDPGVTLNNSFSAPTIIQQRTITVPAAGYVFAIGSADVQYSHTAGTFEFANFGVTKNPAAIPGYQDVAVSVPAAATGGIYNVPATVHDLVPVTAGANTIYFTGYQGSGTNSYTIFDATLTLIYLPTAYGPLSPIVTPGGDPGTSIAPPSDGTANGRAAPSLGWTPEAQQAEIRQAVEFEANRFREEMARMKAQLEAMQAKMDNNGRR